MRCCLFVSQAIWRDVLTCFDFYKNDDLIYSNLSSRGDYMYYFKSPIDERYSLVKLEHTHANVIFEVVQREAAYLREFLDWVDDVKSPDDEAKHIKDTMMLESENKARF